MVLVLLKPATRLGWFVSSEKRSGAVGRGRGVAFATNCRAFCRVWGSGFIGFRGFRV